MTEKFEQEAYQQYLEVYNKMKNDLPDPKDHIPETHSKLEMKQMIHKIYMTKEKIGLTKELEKYLEKYKKHHPKLEEYIETFKKEFLELQKMKQELLDEYKNQVIKDEVRETRELLKENEFINTWQIIKVPNMQEPWKNYIFYEEYILTNPKPLQKDLKKAQNYFAQKRITAIINKWKNEQTMYEFQKLEEQEIMEKLLKEPNNEEFKELKEKLIKLRKVDKNVDQYLSQKELEEEGFTILSSFDNHNEIINSKEQSKLQIPKHFTELRFSKKLPPFYFNKRQKRFEFIDDQKSTNYSQEFIKNCNNLGITLEKTY